MIPNPPRRDMRMADLGHDVALYLTRGEAGIRAKRPMRRRKSDRPSAGGARFSVRPPAGQIDGGTEINAALRCSVVALAEADLVFTQRPSVTALTRSLLAFDAWHRAGRKFALYYYEVDAGFQTTMFRPTHYVDITSVEERKRAACMAHKSQDPQGFYGIHSRMHDFRGLEHGCKFAEAFVHHNQSRAVLLH
jgi:hypothetical protein